MLEKPVRVSGPVPAPFIQRLICASAVSQEVMASEKTARSLCNINFVDAAG